jgi:membrane protease YdiL (CAAX protease family)
MMSDAVSTPGAPRTWYFFGTLGFALLACLASILGGLLTIAVLGLAYHVPPTARYDELFDRADWEAAISLGIFLGQFAVIWLAIRLARRQFSEYLALKWPTREQLFLALLIMFGVLHLLGFIEPLVGEATDAGLIAEYKAAQADGPLLFFLYLVTGCIGAPIFEEFMVRGFLLRGWSESFLRPTGAIVLTSVLWACCHVQYDWFGVFEVFVSGLLLGYFRYRSGSTWLTVVMHSANNLYAYLLIGLTV